MSGLIACGGGGGDSSATTNTTATTSGLVAVPDSISTQQDTQVIVEVLANDRGFAEAIPSISLVSKPTNGKVDIRSNGKLAYKPVKGFSGVDTFVYKITDSSNRSALATVSVHVTCTADCTSSAGSLTLTWNRVPGAVLGYLVYFGNGLVSDPAAVTTIVPKNTVTFDAKADLGLSPGDYACFWVQSVNQAGVSALSAPACGVV